ncbi:MAG TPA: hypothetical protein VIE63_12555 [Ramlibacter sp.]|jgi:hypothetical protein
MPQDRTPLGDAMDHRFPEQKIPDANPAASERRRVERDVSDADLTQPAAERPRVGDDDDARKE